MKLKAEHISFSYPKGWRNDPGKNERTESAGKKVLEDVSLELGSEEINVLMGPSGCGKTTLLRILMGLLRPQTGTVEGLDPGEGIGAVFQEDRLFEHLSVYENLSLVTPDLSAAKAAEVLFALGLGEEVLEESIDALSGGMKRRVSIARALLFPCRVMIMDEPFQGLDLSTREEVMRAIVRLRAGRMLLLVTHERKDASFMNARVIDMESLRK